MEQFGKAIVAVVMAVLLGVLVLKGGQYIASVAHRANSPSEEGCQKPETVDP